MPGFPLGAVISAGGSLLSGLFGNSAQKKQAEYLQKYNRNKVQWLVEDARKAGIHPLAALGSSVAGGFAAPVGGSPLGDAVGDAAREIGGGIESRMQRERAALSNDLIRAQIDETRARQAALIADATSRTQIARLRAAGSDPTTAVVTTPHGDFRTSATTQQQDVEDQYGGIVGEGYGVYRFLNDLKYQKPVRSLTEKYFGK